MTRSDLPASHYLRVYRLKLGLAEGGTTTPAPEFVAFMRQLIENLADVDPSTPVELNTSGNEALFRNALTGSLLGRLRLSEFWLASERTRGVVFVGRWRESMNLNKAASIESALPRAARL
jgi:hypothetical protein